MGLLESALIRIPTGLTFALTTLGGSLLSAQQPPSWNTPRVLALAEQGRATRATTLDGLQGYQAEARGYLYFFLDRGDAGEQHLVKTDQLAVRMFWKTPGRSKQFIVGRRDEKRMPTNIRYHLDHLVVIQENFGDTIRIGDGDEVRAVPHPLARGSGAWYDYLLADSVTVAFGGGLEPVRVYEVQVRPRDVTRPGFVGTVFLDQASAAIVRMNFTFTPASYTDSQLDYIRVSLDNMLWDRRYWLPYRQSLEIRREFALFDLPVGSVIRGRWEIGDYNLEAVLPDAFFAGPEIMRRTEERLRAFPFERGLYAQVDEEGLDPTSELIDIEAEAARLMRGRYLSGLRRLRLFIPPFSEAVRHSRAEGWVTQAGISGRARGRVHFSVLAGYAYGRDQPTGRLGGRLEHPGATTPGHAIEMDFYLYLNEPRDIGQVAGSSRLMNTLGSYLERNDWTDPYFATGAKLGADHSLGPLVARAEVRYERHRNATLATKGETGAEGWRPIRSIREGDLAGARLTLSAGEPGGLFAEIGSGHETLNGASYQEMTLHLGAGRSWLEHGVELHSSLEAGLLSRGAPEQSLYLLGGRETLPGYRYRGLAGDAFWLLRVVGSHELLGPWLGVRAIGAAGKLWRAHNPVPESWDTSTPRITHYSAGAGLALGWNVLHADLVRGLSGGSWEFILDANRRFRGLF